MAKICPDCSGPAGKDACRDCGVCCYCPHNSECVLCACPACGDFGCETCEGAFEANPKDCDHKAIKKLPEKEFRKAVEIIGVQKGYDGEPDLLLGNCKACYSTIAIELPQKNPRPQDMFIVEPVADGEHACYCEGLCHPNADCENAAFARCTFYGHTVLLCVKCMRRHQAAFKKLKTNPRSNPAWWTERDEAMYQAIVDSYRQRGENLAKAKQIAAATVNKWRSEHRQTMAAKKKKK